MPEPLRRWPLVVAVTLAAGCGGDDEPRAAGSGGTSGSGGILGTGGGFPSGGSGGGGAAAGAGGSAYAGPTRYPAASLRSPIAPSVVARARAIAEQAPRAEDVFMKVGASNTVNTGFFHCFAGANVELDGRAHLDATLTHFRAGSAGGKTPFDRQSLAAKVGAGAVWSMTGSPPPVEQEIAAIDPRYALVHYGTNDMQLGVSHQSALFPFFENLSLLLDHLESSGVVPIVSALPPRSDTVAAARWVPTYDAATRAIAEARQLPFISVYGAWSPLPNQGLISDGLHGNAFSGGACVLTAAGLQHGFNTRNLLTLEQLDVTRRVLAGEAAPDVAIAHQGSGSAADPFLVDALPFTHSGDTSLSSSRGIDSYPGCSATQDESGPELFYRLELDAPTPLRAVLLDRAGVDVDLHLLAAEPTGQACQVRADRIVQGTFGPGTVYLAVDSFVSSAGEQAGPYLLVVVRCEAGDPDCG